ncbi:hypothetical protein [Nocardia sp. NPDC004711]
MNGQSNRSKHALQLRNWREITVLQLIVRDCTGRPKLGHERTLPGIDAERVEGVLASDEAWHFTA